MELNARQFALLNQWFEQAVDLPPPQRDAFVAGVRTEHGDQLAAELVRLFTAGDEPTGTMNFAPPSVAQPPAFHAGETIIERFRIVRALGRGGMGEVYEAQDRELGPVALKTIRRDLLGDPGVLRRFKQEVQLARQVTSPHVCRIHELFMLPDDGRHRPGAFLTMELVEGDTLAHRIQQGPLAWSEAEPIVMELCEGLQALHSLGLVHRDFKPANTMLARRGKLTQAVVMDLGLALRPDDSAGGNGKLTMTGGIVGTPGYMAPEQFEGSQVSPATDIYALGLVLYEMTTGRRPFEASTPLAAAVRRAKRPPPVSSLRPGLPRRLDLVIEKCLEFDPADRFASAEAVAKALRDDTNDLPPAGSRRRRQVLAALAVVALALFLTAGFILRSRLHKDSAGGSAEATRWYNQGTAALREGTYLKATNALERAVNLDKNFALAHVRLADAWNELDFSGRAKDEMLQASAFESNGILSAIDKMYVEAVRHTIVRDFPAALRDYRSILDELPSESKGDGYVDVGRAYEKAGDTQQAISAYSTAAKLDPEYPAAFVRLAVLEDRRKHTAAANAAYAKAGSLYRAASNVEGLAEIDLQRGNNANTQLRLDEARADLNRSLQAARDIHSPQLEIRALTRLSVTEYLAHNTGDSLRLANQAVAMAEENGLEYWAIDGVTRLGNAYISSGNNDKAGQSFEQALSLAQKSQRPRLIALAELGLAQVRESQNRPGEALPIAKAALDYYRGNGFKSESGEALTLLLRAQRDTADNQAALQSSQQLLALAAELDDPAVRMRAEEAAGAVLFNLERYPEALDHVQKALAASRLLNQQVEYHLLDYADTVWRLGEYEEAHRSLAGIPASSRSRPDIRVRINETTAGMLLSQKRYTEAKNVIQQALADKSNDDPAFFYRLMGQVETAASRPGQAREWCRKALDQAVKEGDRPTIAASQLALANAYLAGQPVDAAAPLAQTAHDFFAASGQRESQYLALLTLAKIARAAQDPVKSKALAQQGMDILAGLEHNYSPQQYQKYLSRADINEARSQLAALAKSSLAK